MKEEVFPSRRLAGSTLRPGQPAVSHLAGTVKDNAARGGCCWGQEEKANTRSTDRDSKVKVSNNLNKGSFQRCS